MIYSNLWPILPSLSYASGYTIVSLETISKHVLEQKEANILRARILLHLQSECSKSDKKTKGVV